MKASRNIQDDEGHGMNGRLYEWRGLESLPGLGMSERFTTRANRLPEQVNPNHLKCA
jgi:hypothetical protein